MASLLGRVGNPPRAEGISPYSGASAFNLRRGFQREKQSQIILVDIVLGAGSKQTEEE